MEPNDKKPASIPDAIDIFYDKSPLFRSIHPGGAWAGITPELEIQMFFFTNLQPAPEYVRQKVTPEGGLGEELDKIVKKGISREYEVAIVVNKAVAVQIVDLLTRMIKQLPDVPVVNYEVKQAINQ